MENNNRYKTLASIAIVIFGWHIQSSFATEPQKNTSHQLFEDNFSLEGNLADDHHWLLISGDWQVSKGVLAVVNEWGPETEAYILAGDSTWADYQITGKVCPGKKNNVDNDAGILLRVNSDEPFGSRYTICLNPFKNWVGCANDRGPKQWIGHGKFHFTPGRWYDFNASVRGNELDFSLNGKQILHCDHLLLTHGKFGLEAWNKGIQKFRDIKVTKID